MPGCEGLWLVHSRNETVSAEAAEEPPDIGAVPPQHRVDVGSQAMNPTGDRREQWRAAASRKRLTAGADRRVSAYRAGRETAR